MNCFDGVRGGAHRCARVRFKVSGLVARSFEPNCPLLWLSCLSCLSSSAAVLLADQYISDRRGRVSEVRLRRSQRLQQRLNGAGHAHGGGLWDHESGVGHCGVHGCVLLPWPGTGAPALQRLSQKPLLQRWRLCGLSTWLQVRFCLLCFIFRLIREKLQEGKIKVVYEEICIFS